MRSNYKNIAVRLILFILFWLFTLSPIAQARPMYQPQLRPLEGCHACHENQGGGGPMNAYGADWVGAGNNAKAIADNDSDGDGFTNGEEIKDGTYPGDPSSNREATSPIWLYLIVSIILIGGTIALFVAAAKVRANKESSD